MKGGSFSLEAKRTAGDPRSRAAFRHPLLPRVRHLRRGTCSSIRQEEQQQPEADGVERLISGQPVRPSPNSLCLTRMICVGHTIRCTTPAVAISPQRSRILIPARLVVSVHRVNLLTVLHCIFGIRLLGTKKLPNRGRGNPCDCADERERCGEMARDPRDERTAFRSWFPRRRPT